MKKTLTLALAFTLLCGTAAFAGMSKTAVLTPPSLSDQADDPDPGGVNFGGVAVIESNGPAARRSETFAIRVFANVKDGVSYTVHVKCDTGLVEMGTIKTLLGSAALKIEDPAVPVHTMRKVQVRDKRGVVILRGSFARPSATR
jgi:hypothetical protein